MIITLIAALVKALVAVLILVISLVVLGEPLTGILIWIVVELRRYVIHIFWLLSFLYPITKVINFL